MEVKGVIKLEMLEQGLSYEAVAKGIGWTRQNLWNKLNMGGQPNFETGVIILRELGCEVEIRGNRKGRNRKEILNRILEATALEQVSFECVRKIIDALGCELVILNSKKCVISS